jgi:hypothetical protein
MMKKFAILLVGLLLTGCAREPIPTYPLASQPTLPSFSQTLSPLEQLQQAQEAVRAAGSFQIAFPGGVQQVILGEQSLLETEDYKLLYDASGCYRMDLHGENPQWELQEHQGTIGEADIFATLRALIPNENLLGDLCKQSLIVSPSNDGSFRYQLTQLTLEELYTLVHGVAPGEELPEGVGAACVTVDSQGYLSQIRFDAHLAEGESHDLTVEISRVGQ